MGNWRSARSGFPTFSYLHLFPQVRAHVAREGEDEEDDEYQLDKVIYSVCLPDRSDFQLAAIQLS